MKTNSFKEGVALVATIAAIALTSFRNNDEGNTDRPFLQAINSHASTTLITYNLQHAISRLTRIQRTVEETYTDIRIPVYESGHLVSTLVSDRANGEDSQLFSSFDYTDDYSRIEKIHYYTEGSIQAYDSLVYNETGHITARYFFGKNVNNHFENHNYQAYTWDNAGNVIQLDNYGRMGTSGNFALSSTMLYSYDKKLNPQQRINGLCYITDIMPAFLSNNNVLTEQIISTQGADKTTTSYKYEYNSAQYPTSVTAIYGADGSRETTRLSYE
ncbi:hypothetical protein [Chitinophaga sp. GbtcB8]|uniref:hypothetical protein n=1 Tax=Chitinophaga sp. GbtcB8 TaxID=2824753 RepID=UPI001C30B626|nr:hypothetical protein [Chitinophaga sp. GbtcB8]